MSHEIRVALRKRFAPPSWALLEEVRNKTGYGGGAERYADAVAMSLWPSRGLELHGVEIKASRSDWVRERDDPEKAEAIATYCDRWWLVVASDTIVRDGELPPSWGLILMTPTGLKTVREAPKRKAKPVDRRFLAALLRRATEFRASMTPNDQIEEVVEQRVKTKLATTPEGRYKDEAEVLRKRLDTVLSALGLHEWEIHDHALPNIKEAFDVVSNRERRVDLIEHMQRDMKRADEYRALIKRNIEALENAYGSEGSKE